MKRRNVCYLPHLIAWENLKKEDFTLTSLSQVLSETHKGLKHVILKIKMFALSEAGEYSFSHVHIYNISNVKKR